MSPIPGTATGRATDVRIGMTTDQNIRAAVKEFSNQIFQPDTALVVVFASSSYDPAQLGPLLKEAFPGSPVVGCTTAGEITPDGYCENSITGFSLSGQHSRVHTYTLDSLKNLNPTSIRDLAENAKKRMASFRKDQPETREFALFLIDGMSGKEEEVVAFVHQALDNVPLVGGSAGDNLHFKRTWVLTDGCFRTDAAVLTIVSTVLPFETFKTQHFLPTKTKLVITEADPSTRTVREINGLPADQEYARLIGIEAGELVPTVFSQYPVMLKIGGEYYVRALQRKNPDGSLTFYCAIDNGLVLTIGRGVDMVDNLQQSLDAVASRLNEPQLLISCECVLRRLEVLQAGLTEPIDGVLSRHHAVGFHSYGEQFNAIHVNQTFSGVMIGRRP